MGQDAADPLVELGIVLAGVQHARGLAQGFGGGPAGDPFERGVHGDEAEFRVDHRHGFVHVAEHFDRDACFALGGAQGVDIARGAGETDQRAGGVAFDHAAACADPAPSPIAVADAVLGVEPFRVAVGVAFDVLPEPRHVVGMDEGVAPRVDGDVGGCHRAGERLDALKTQVAAADIEFPVGVAAAREHEVDLLLELAGLCDARLLVERTSARGPGPCHEDDHEGRRQHAGHEPRHPRAGPGEQRAGGRGGFGRTAQHHARISSTPTG